MEAIEATGERVAGRDALLATLMPPSDRALRVNARIIASAVAIGILKPAEAMAELNRQVEAMR